MIVLMHMVWTDLARSLLNENIRAHMDGLSEDAVNAAGMLRLLGVISTSDCPGFHFRNPEGKAPSS